MTAIIDTIEAATSGELEVSINAAGRVELVLGDGGFCISNDFTAEQVARAVRALCNALAGMREVVPVDHGQRTIEAVERVHRAKEALRTCGPVREQRAERERVLELRVDELLALLPSVVAGPT